MGRAGTPGGRSWTRAVDKGKGQNGRRPVPWVWQRDEREGFAVSATATREAAYHGARKERRCVASHGGWRMVGKLRRLLRECGQTGGTHAGKKERGLRVQWWLQAGTSTRNWRLLSRIKSSHECTQSFGAADGARCASRREAKSSGSCKRRRGWHSAECARRAGSPRSPGPGQGVSHAGSGWEGRPAEAPSSGRPLRAWRGSKCWRAKKNARS